MKTVEIIGFKRANLGKSDAKSLRAEGNVPCVLYGGEEQIHFYAPMILFRPLIYTPEIFYVILNVEGQEYKAILQDVQFHPVSDIILHADFLLLQDGKPIKMGIPFEFVGSAPGLLKGGKLMVKQRKVMVKALPKDMPEKISIDISNLELGRTVKMRDVTTENFELLASPQVTIATVSIPRLARLEEEVPEAELEEEGVEGEDGGASEGGSEEGGEEEKE